jgi:cysteine synthase A
MLVTTENHMKAAGGGLNLLVASSILDLIGNTPVLELGKVRRHLNLCGRIMAKLEHLNPGGSKKDRVALSMIREARRTGRLVEGQAVVESPAATRGRAWQSSARRWATPFTL